jgi:uncharacterized protein YcbK (DUF882 family)
MSLATRLSDFATRTATEAKALRTLINGNAANLTALTTTAKGNLVVAVNELVSRIGALESGAAGIDDSSTSTTKTWSSSKTNTMITSASTADRTRSNHTGTQSADTVVDGTTNKVLTAAMSTKLAGIATGATANSPDATLLARANHTGSQPSTTISDFAAAADARIANWVGAAPAALDTVLEISNALGGDANFAGTMTAALGNRVRVDDAQSFTAPQKAQALTNIGAAAAADLTALSTAVGNTEQDLVAVFVAGLA